VRHSRDRALIAAIAAATVYGISIGQAVPLLSLLLEHRGTDAMLTGINAAAAFAGVLAGPLMTSHGVRAMGVRNFLMLCLALETAIFPLFKLCDSFAGWLVMRVVCGIIGANLFTASEAWINLLAADRGRGRIVGLYATALSAGFAIGPMVLSFTGIAGWLPFIVNCAITIVALLPLLSVSNKVGNFGSQRGPNPLVMFLRAPVIVLSIALFGLYEATMLALLPIWGVRMGFTPQLAAAGVSAVFIGSISLQWPIGWLSDHAPRLVTLRLCGAAALAGSLVLVALARPVPSFLAVLGIWGGVASALYPIALSMAGDRFRGSELVSINAAIIIAYGIGGTVGPGLGGLAMDRWAPQGLPTFFALLFSVFLGVSLAPFSRSSAPGFPE